jgi:hypothetical protein
VKKPRPDDVDGASERPPRAEKSRKRKLEPLPPLPHLEPDLPPSRSVEPARAPPATREQTPVREQTPLPPLPTLEPERPPPAKVDPPSSSSWLPPASLTPPPVQTAPPGAAPQAALPAPAASGPTTAPGASPVSRPDDEDAPVPPRWRRSLTVLALGGLWQTQRGDSMAFDPAYGLQVGYAIVPWLLVDVTAMRAGSTQGNGFASATVNHTFFAGRLWLAWNKGFLSLIGGGGFGGTLAQTRYFLQDVGQPPATIDANALELAAQAGLGARLRPWSGLEIRVEVTSLLREGRFEPLLIGGAGWAF